MGLVEKLLDTYIPADEMGKKMGNQKESDCVSRLVVLFGCYYFSSILILGLRKERCAVRDLTLFHFAVYFFSQLISACGARC